MAPQWPFWNRAASFWGTGPHSERSTNTGDSRSKDFTQPATHFPLLRLGHFPLFLCHTHLQSFNIYSIYTVYLYKWISFTLYNKKKCPKYGDRRRFSIFTCSPNLFFTLKKKKLPVEQCKHSWILQVAVPDPILLKTKRKFLQELMWLQISCDHKPLFSVTGLRLHLEMRCKLDIYPMTWFCSCSVHIVTAADPFIQR